TDNGAVAGREDGTSARSQRMQDLRSGSSASALYSAACGIGDGLGASPSSASISSRSRSLMGMFGSRSYALRYQGQHAVGRLRASPGLQDRPVDCPRIFGPMSHAPSSRASNNESL